MSGEPVKPPQGIPAWDTTTFVKWTQELMTKYKKLQQKEKGNGNR